MTQTLKFTRHHHPGCDTYEAGGVPAVLIVSQVRLALALASKGPGALAVHSAPSGLPWISGVRGQLNTNKQVKGCVRESDD